MKKVAGNGVEGPSAPSLNSMAQKQPQPNDDESKASKPRKKRKLRHWVLGGFAALIVGVPAAQSLAANILPKAPGWSASDTRDVDNSGVPQGRPSGPPSGDLVIGSQPNCMEPPEQVPLTSIDEGKGQPTVYVTQDCDKLSIAVESERGIRSLGPGKVKNGRETDAEFSGLGGDPSTALIEARLPKEMPPGENLIVLAFRFGDDDRNIQMREITLRLKTRNSGVTQVDRVFGANETKSNVKVERPHVVPASPGVGLGR